MKTTIIIFITAIFLAQNVLTIGQKPPYLELSKHEEGTLEGDAWSSKEIGNKVTIVMYVDPDKVKDNLHVEEALQKTFSEGQIKAIAIANMKSSWRPNFAIKKKLAEKKQHNKNLEVVLDYSRSGEKKWGLPSDTYTVMAFDKSSQLIFLNKGIVTEEQLASLIDKIKKNL